MEIDNIYNMDCLEGMKQIPDGTIDAVICDLPYGTMKGAQLDGWEGVKTAIGTKSYRPTNSLPNTTECCGRMVPPSYSVRSHTQTIFEAISTRTSNFFAIR